MNELIADLSEYFVFYNGERAHQALENLTPYIEYQTSFGSGAMILDKYPRAVDKPKEGEKATSGQCVQL